MSALAEASRSALPLDDLLRISDGTATGQMWQCMRRSADPRPGRAGQVPAPPGGPPPAESGSRPSPNSARCVVRPRPLAEPRRLQGGERRRP